MIYKGIAVQSSDNIDFGAKLYADYPDLFFRMGLVEKIETGQGTQKMIQFEDVSEELPIFPLSGNTYEPTLSR